MSLVLLMVLQAAPPLEDPIRIPLYSVLQSTECPVGDLLKGECSILPVSVLFHI